MWSDIKQHYSFPTDHYFRTIAKTLFRDHGEKALNYAAHAMDQMNELGSEEGEAIWGEIYRNLSEIHCHAEMSRSTPLN